MPEARGLPGRLIAAALERAWRASPPPIELSAEQLNEIAPSLLGSGAGALGWWRVRNSELKETPAGIELHEAYRRHALQSAIHESDIKQIFTLLRSGGIEPVLVKGWAAARLYPENGLRPYGDIDLCFAAGDYPKARAILGSPEGRMFNVDSHRGLAMLDDRRLDDLLARSRLIKLGGVDVRVFAPEDELRIQSFHLLRHGAWRPLWLCDIAAMVESRAADFDWDLCLGPRKRPADWIACTIGLAGRLLRARIEDTPAASRAKQLPTWLTATVLKQWETYPALREPLTRQRAMRTYWRRPAGVLNAIYSRWPDPIAATITVKGNFNDLPRLPYQLGSVVVRLAKLLAGSAGAPPA